MNSTATIQRNIMALTGRSDTCQVEIIRIHLLRVGPISPTRAENSYGIKNLAQVVSTLRKTVNIRFNRVDEVYELSQDDLSTIAAQCLMILRRLRTTAREIREAAEPFILKPMEDHNA